MDTGFLVYVSSDAGRITVNLPEVLIPKENVEIVLQQINQAIRVWIAENQDKPASMLSIHLTGPIESVPKLRKTPESVLADAETQLDRFYALGDAAMSRTDAGDLGLARAYSTELQNLLPIYRDN